MKKIAIIALLIIIGVLVVSKYGERTEKELISPLPECPEAIPTPTVQYRKTYIGKVSFYTKIYCINHNPACITASGEPFDDMDFTAACSYRFPLGSRLLVKYKENQVEVRCNDRGSFEEKYGRILDLSKAAFAALAPLEKGVIQVEITPIAIKEEK